MRIERLDVESVMAVFDYAMGKRTDPSSVSLRNMQQVVIGSVATVDRQDLPDKRTASIKRLFWQGVLAFWVLIVLLHKQYLCVNAS